MVGLMLFMAPSKLNLKRSSSDLDSSKPTTRSARKLMIILTYFKDILAFYSRSFIVIKYI